MSAYAERMASEFLSEDIWKQVSKEARAYRGKSFVAVAYFGTGAAEMLPLKAGSHLVVDASDRAMKSGQTNPAELLKLYEKGVKVFSCKDLHAKVFVFGKTAYVGSANVSSNSAKIYREAVVRASDNSVVGDARRFVQDLALRELGPKEIEKLLAKYVPPKGGRGSKGKRGPRKSNLRLRIVFLDDPEDPPEEAKDGITKGEKIAKQLMIDNSRHELDYVWHNYDTKFVKGDVLLRVWPSEFVSPPSTVLNVTRTADIVVTHIECPKKHRKSLRSLKAKLSKSAFDRLKRQGIVGETVAKELLKAWGE